MAPVHSTHSSMRQHCFCILGCSSDRAAFLEFSKLSESGIRESKRKKPGVVSGRSSLFVSL